MGNCQAIDTATLVIQYPSGKSEKLYWPVSASEIMKANPGHYVALLISTTLCPQKPKPPNNNNNNNNNTQQQQQQQQDQTTNTNHNLNNNNDSNSSAGSVRLTRIKLLRPTDTLVLGQVYRLITTQEVMKGLWAKKQAKLKRNQSSEGGVRVEIMGREKHGITGSEFDKNNKATKHERHRPRPAGPAATPSTSSANSSAVAKSRIWQPSLHSISEATS